MQCFYRTMSCFYITMKSFYRTMSCFYRTMQCFYRTMSCLYRIPQEKEVQGLMCAVMYSGPGLTLCLSVRSCPSFVCDTAAPGLADSPYGHLLDPSHWTEIGLCCNTVHTVQCTHLAIRASLAPRDTLFWVILIKDPSETQKKPADRPVIFQCF